MKIRSMVDARELIFDLLSAGVREAPYEMSIEVISELDAISAQWTLMAAQEFLVGFASELVDHWDDYSDISREEIENLFLDRLRASYI